MSYSEKMVVDTYVSAYAENLCRQIRENQSFEEIFNKALKALENYEYPGLVGTAHVIDYVKKKIDELYPNDPQREKIIEVAKKLANYLWNGVKPTSIKKMVEDRLKKTY